MVLFDDGIIDAEDGKKSDTFQVIFGITVRNQRGESRKKSRKMKIYAVYDTNILISSLLSALGTA